MLVTVYSPSNKLYDKVKTKSVYLPSEAGDMQVLDNHIPVIVSLRPGNIILEKHDGEKETIEVDEGYAQFADNTMTIVVVDTHLTEEQLQKIEAKAAARKDREIREEDEISEEEFLNMEKSERI